MTEGRFAVIEGIDGSGKTTQQLLLSDLLKSRGRKVLSINSPSEWYRRQPEVAEYISSGTRRIGANTLAVLAAADRMLAGDLVINPALESGTDVIAARYTYSAIAYSAARGADTDYVKMLNSHVVRPTHGVLLALPPRTAQGRILARGEELTYEEQDPLYLQRIQEAMLEVWPDDFLKLDATLPPEKILNIIDDYIQPKKEDHES